MHSPQNLFSAQEKILTTTPLKQMLTLLFYQSQVLNLTHCLHLDQREDLHRNPPALKILKQLQKRCQFCNSTPPSFMYSTIPIVRSTQKLHSGMQIIGNEMGCLGVDVIKKVPSYNILRQAAHSHGYNKKGIPYDLHWQSD